MKSLLDHDEPETRLAQLLLVYPESLGMHEAAHLKRAHEGLVHTHHGSSVVKLPAIVRCRKQRHQLSLCKKFIAVLNNL